MKKLLKKIFFFLSFILLYLVVKEFLQLYAYLTSVNQLLAIVVIALLGIVVLYFGIFPLVKIFFLPKSLGPTKDKSEVDALLAGRIKKLKKNPYLVKNGFDFTQVKENKESYSLLISELKPEAQRIRKKYVNSVFYGTAISQNGFLDAIMIFSASVNMVKEMFTLYNGRVNNKDLFAIGRRVYYSIVIGGSEGIEYATDEVFSKLATESMKSIPFLDKIFTSLADGFVNAVLLTRISLITENYCTKLLIENEKELYPKPSFVVETAKDLTKDALISAKNNMLNLAKQKSELLFKKTFNPVMLVLDKSYSSVKESKTFESGKQIFRKRFSEIKMFKKKH